VARLAGVSPMTVSRVINAETNVREETRAEVNAWIKALRSHSGGKKPSQR